MAMDTLLRDKKKEREKFKNEKPCQIEVGLSFTT